MTNKGNKALYLKENKTLSEKPSLKFLASILYVQEHEVLNPKVKLFTNIVFT